MIEFTPWLWVILACLLMGLELIIPGAFMLWFGLAALLTAGVVSFFVLSQPLQVFIFALISVALVIIGVVLKKRLRVTDTDHSQNRVERLVGQSFVLEEAIVNGHGVIRVGDSPWRVSGEDAPAGQKVRVARVDGAQVFVEPV